MATTATTSPLDLTAVKQAIDLVHKGRQGEATDVEGTISDLIARKLVELKTARASSRVMPRSSPPIRVGPASRRCGGEPRR
jgi:hypothetical protein